MNAIALSISNTPIRQDDQGRFCLNDLHKASGSESKHQPSNWLRAQQTTDLIRFLKYEESKTKNDPIYTKQGQGTYAVKELVYAYAMWISAKFHIAVIRAYDAMVSTPRNGLVEITEPLKITNQQAGELHKIVSDKSASSGKPRGYYWSRFNNHFKLASYRHLHFVRFDEAVSYLRGLEGDSDLMYVTPRELNDLVNYKVSEALRGEIVPAERKPDGLVIPISLDGGTRAASIMLNGSVGFPARYLISIDGARITSHELPRDACIFTESDFITYLRRECGYVVVKKSEVANKLMA